MRYSQQQNVPTAISLLGP